jgi:hypothetical protein
MVALSERKIEIVRTLVESAPDKIVGGLQRALSESANDSVLASVRILVEAEAADRALRNAVLQAVAPLCVGDGSDKRRLVFPARALGCVWRGLKVLAPKEVSAASHVVMAIAATPEDKRAPDPAPAFDALARLAANAIRTSQLRDFLTAAELCDRARPNGAELFAACLDLGPVVRRASARLPDWLAHGGDETAAGARLAYKDAVTISDDAGPRFFEMLAGQLDPPWLVMRVISAVMDKPTERYLADSELGGFAERVMDDIDISLAAIKALDAARGSPAGLATGKLTELVTDQITELELCIELSRDHGWGKRIYNQKQSLAALVEAHLRETEKAVIAALPMEAVKGRVRKAIPKLSGPPDPVAVTKAMAFLTFVDEVRSCANYAGFSAAHAKLLEKLAPYLDHYVEDALDLVRTADAESTASAHDYLRVVADFEGLARDERAAELIRRRAISACQTEG